MMIRVDTTENDAGDIEVGWVGASFGALPNNAKFFAANYRISLIQGVVEVRVRGSDVGHQPGFQIHKNMAFNFLEMNLK